MEAGGIKYPASPEELEGEKTDDHPGRQLSERKFNRHQQTQIVGLRISSCVSVVFPSRCSLSELSQTSECLYADFSSHSLGPEDGFPLNLLILVQELSASLGRHL